MKNDKCHWHSDGRHQFVNRRRIGPTSRKRDWMILVDSCGCGCCRPVFPGDLTWKQDDWINRCNSRTENCYEKNS